MSLLLCSLDWMNSWMFSSKRLEVSNTEEDTQSLNQVLFKYIVLFVQQLVSSVGLMRSC